MWISMFLFYFREGRGTRAQGGEVARRKIRREQGMEKMSNEDYYTQEEWGSSVMSSCV